MRCILLGLLIKLALMTLAKPDVYNYFNIEYKMKLATKLENIIAYICDDKIKSIIEKLIGFKTPKKSKKEFKPECIKALHKGKLIFL